jgi:hypothetical protein
MPFWPVSYFLILEIMTVILNRYSSCLTGKRRPNAFWLCTGAKQITNAFLRPLAFRLFIFSSINSDQPQFNPPVLPLVQSSYSIRFFIWWHFRFSQRRLWRWLSSGLLTWLQAANTSATLINVYQITRRNNPEDSHLHPFICLLQYHQVSRSIWYFEQWTVAFQSWTSTSLSGN